MNFCDYNIPAPAVNPDKDPYYHRSEVSNSDLSALKKLWMNETHVYDVEQAYRFGTLVDVMVTEPSKMDVYKRRIFGQQWIYSVEEVELATEMKKAFFRDPFCSQMSKNCCFQKVSTRSEFWIRSGSIEFCLPVRCKWDLFVEAFDMSGDLKTTTATTQKQFEEAVRYFDYDRQRAWYMDIESRKNDILIGISKKNLQVFKLPVTQAIYNTGKSKYVPLAEQYWQLFGDITKVRTAA